MKASSFLQSEFNTLPRTLEILVQYMKIIPLEVLIFDPPKSGDEQGIDLDPPKSGDEQISEIIIKKAIVISIYFKYTKKRAIEISIYFKCTYIILFVLVSTRFNSPPSIGMDLYS